MSRSWCRRSRFIGEPVEPRPAPNVILSVAKNLGQWPVSRLRRSCLLTFHRGGFETCPPASPKRSPVWGPFRSPRTAKRTPSPYSSLVKGEEGWVTVYDDFLCKAVLVRAVGEERRSKDRDVDQAPHAEGNRGRGAAGQEHPQSPPSEVSRVPGSGVRGRGSGERETTASSLAGKQQAREKEDNGGQGKDGPAGAIAQGGNGR